MTNGICHKQKWAFAHYSREQYDNTQYYISDYFEYLQGQVEKVNALFVRFFGVDHASRVPHFVQ